MSASQRSIEAKFLSMQTLAHFKDRLGAANAAFKGNLDLAIEKTRPLYLSLRLKLRHLELLKNFTGIFQNLSPHVQVELRTKQMQYEVALVLP